MTTEEESMTTKELDGAKAEEFAGKMVGVLNDAMLALMTSVGHRTGLLDAMAEMPPSTSEGVASAANLDERYVREWLGAMVVGGIVEHDPEPKTYRLPPEHAACLTREAGSDNLANLAQFVSLLGDVEGGVVESFRNGGGVPYSEYAGFQALMAEDSAQVYGATLVESTLPLIPGMVESLEGGAEVLDVGCGAGVAANLMARAFPASRFAGYDLSEEGVAAARAESPSNARFEVKDLRALDEREAYDLVTAFDVIHDLAHPAEVLENIHAALRHGGTFLMVDVAASSHLHENLEHPLGPFLYTVSTMHCMTVSLSQGGEGLGAVWGEEKAKDMLAEAGFREVEVKRVEGDILNNYYVARKER